MLQKIQADIESKKLQVKDLENTMSALYKDKTLIPDFPTPFGQGKYAREGGAWDSRCESASRTAGGCGALGGDYFNRQKEKRTLAEQKHIAPLKRKKEILVKEIEKLELKSTLPYLRNELISSVTEFETLEKTDLQYRQKQIDLKKSIYQQSQQVDELETKFNWFGNIPTSQPKTITPDPIVKTTLDYEVNKRPLLILGALGLIGLFLIWRFK